MKDHIAKQAYDKGFDAGAADTAKGLAGVTCNPYQLNRTLRTYGRYDYWDMGYRDGSTGHKRRMSQEEADRRNRARLEQLETFRSRVLNAFAMHRIRCDCAGITHEVRCPLGALEVEADAIWRGEAVAS